MKKVINTTENTITLQEVLNEAMPVIGFQYGGTKVTLVPLKYNSKKYFARCFDSWERGNGYDPFGVDTKTIEEWEMFFRTLHEADMFVFDSSKEMFEWFVK